MITNIIVIIIECQMFLRNRIEELSKNSGEPYAAMISRIR